MGKERIADVTKKVISAYQAKVGYLVEPPVPVEDIIERLLNVKLDYMDFEEMLGITGVLGATYIHKRLICINEKLLNDKSEGRLAFTCSHEIGHWVLHRKFVHTTGKSVKDKDTIICRSKNAKLPVEWQADYFASCLLMPEEYVKSAYYRTYGPKPLVLYNVNGAYAGPLCFDPCVKNWPLIALAVIESGRFTNVSKQAMIIRLQDLGLVVNKTDARMEWSRYYSQAYKI
jgi:Zn-dependent peptidase ImmA (M78 family)